MQLLVNGHKPDRKEFWIYYAWLFFSYAVVIYIIAALSKDINRLIYDWTCNWVVGPKSVFEFVEANWVGNLIFFVWVGLGLGVYVWKNWRNKFFSFHYVAFAIGLSILILNQDVWTYAATPIPFVGYDWFVVIVGIGFAIWNVLRCVRKDREPGREKTRKIVLTSDEIKNVVISPAREAYAQQLVTELLTSNLHEETYAVAITGGWGSGKSRFLKCVKEKLAGHAIVIDFNPWNSQDEKHLVKDFFDALSAGIAPYYRGIGRLLNKYAKVLYSLRVSVASDFVLQHFPIHEPEKIEKKKKDVADALKNIQMPIVVAIDDLDRLTGSEIFEVLRIIRNTAKFNNIIYIVTYDKDHVVNQLKQPSLGIEKDYLEKIFQIELSMPKVDERMLEEEFRLLCRNGVTRTTQINSVLDSLTEEDYAQILKVMGSFRKIKRFARQFSFNANYMANSFVESKGLSLMDVMFLNIVQALDYQLYQRIWQKPETLFDIKLHSNTKCQYYLLKRDAVKDERTSYFMKRMFGASTGQEANSIQMIDAYYKYFYLTQPGKALTDEEFQKMLKLPGSEAANNGMKVAIRSWVLSKESKSAPSIYACFANSKPKVHSDLSESKAFLTALFYWLEYEDRVDANLIEVLPHLLDISLYAANIRQALNDEAVTQLVRWIAKNPNEKCAKILSELYVRIDGGAKLLIDNGQVKQVIEFAINQFLLLQDWDAVLLFKGDANQMLSVVKSYCVVLPNSGKKINLAMDELIAYFSQPAHKSRNTNIIAGFTEALKVYNVYGEGADSSFDWKEMKSIFGDDMDKAKEYVEKCFV